ncbi:hypothetical protein SADUNF_Sadunf08G0016600 [Salix dunnii]|uniref:Uncharacterized protein n=1 Tax=Salix dunnii TaxID=1413687 RepID=A0A835JXS2_9ROSI|nr:hypothetical protein SADUNF_Sadunf08G0016600 [Salix dunnii]
MMIHEREKYINNQECAPPKGSSPSGPGLGGFNSWIVAPLWVQIEPTKRQHRNKVEFIYSTQEKQLKEKGKKCEPNSSSSIQLLKNEKQALVGSKFWLPIKHSIVLQKSIHHSYRKKRNK